MHSSNEKPPSESERIRWVMLGLGSPDDIRDIPASRVEEEKKRLDSTAKQFTLLDVKLKPTRNRISRRRIFKVAAMVGCTSLVIYGAFASIKNVAANQQVRAGNRYALSLLEFSLDLFEEDMEVLADQAAQSQQLLPAPQFLTFDDRTRQRIQSCPQALQALTSVRMGFPEVGFLQLEPVVRSMNEHGVWTSNGSSPEAERDLEFIFNLTAGKAIFEAMQTGIGRSFMDAENAKLYAQLTVQSIDMLEHSLTLLEQQRITSLTEDERTILKSAILIDLARGRLKFGSGTKSPTREFQTQWLKQTQIDLAEVQLSLESLDRFDPRCLIQKARCLNNRILNSERITLHRLERVDDELPILIDELRAEISELVFDAAAIKDAEHAPAIDFEIAICYSNLADLIRSVWEYGQVDVANSGLEQRLELRRQAIELLNKVPRLSRTERHFENLVSNQTRYVQAVFVDGLTGDVNFQPSQDLQNRASQLHRVAGDLLADKNVGQMPVESRLAAAMILNDEYSPEEIQQFAARLPPEPSDKFRSRQILLRRLQSMSTDSVQQID